MLLHFGGWQSLAGGSDVYGRIYSSHSFLSQFSHCLYYDSIISMI